MIKIAFLGPEEGFEAAASCLPEFMLLVRCKAKTNVVVSELKDSHALIDASMKVPITEDILAQATNLKIISTATTGADHIDINVLRQRKIVLHTLKEDKELLRNLTPAAEHAWLLLMALAGKLVPACIHVSAGGWDRELFPSVMLNGKTLGLIGCGRIGQHMARYAQAFEMRVKGYDPYLFPWPEGIESVTLEALFETSDIISVHVHLTEDTAGLITQDLFRRVRPGAIFINTSRGGVIDEKSMLETLQSGQLGGVGLDVLQGEPNINGNFLVEYSKGNANLLITPHCGGYSPDAVRIVCKRAMEKVIRFFQETLT